MTEKIQKDLYRYTGKKSGSPFLYIFKNRFFRFQYFYRKCCHYPKNTIKGFIYHIIYNRMIVNHGSIIEPYDQIGPGFCILSRNLIMINADSNIGENFTMNQGVTIGIANRGKLKGAPTIGDNVYVGQYTTIVGNIKIGNNVRIAPNSYVNIDIPDNSYVYGNPVKIVPDENATEGYLINKI